MKIMVWFVGWIFFLFELDNIVRYVFGSEDGF